MPQQPDQMYQIAYKLHYTEKNLNEALVVYQEIVNKFPDSPEAGYSKTQIENIESMNPQLRARMQLLGNKLAADTKEETGLSRNSDNQEVENSNRETEKPSIPYNPYIKTPVLSGILYFFGVLSIIGGLICAKTFWPDSSALEVGYVYKTAAYIPSTAWLISGIISMFVFFALGKIIDDLGVLKHNVKYLIKKETK
jgi:hypothetical protein